MYLFVRYHLYYAWLQDIVTAVVLIVFSAAKWPYYIIIVIAMTQIDNGQPKDLFTTGNASGAEPNVTKLSEDMLALGRDNMSIIIDSEGQPAKKYALTWSDVPLVLGTPWNIHS